MRVGFIGAGTVTGTFGRHLIAAGHSVVVSNSRGPETLAKFVADLGPGAIAGTKQQAAECDVVILATHWVSVADALNGSSGQRRLQIGGRCLLGSTYRLTPGSPTPPSATRSTRSIRDLSSAPTNVRGAR